MEIWKDVVGFEDSYEISNEGNLRSKDRYVKHWRGGLRLYKSKPKNTRLNDKGYFRCNLKSDGKRFDFTIHRLVAEAFLPNPENKPCINHINGIKTDNRLENLEWCNLEENTTHAVGTRLIETKLTDEEARFIHDSPLSTRKLAKMFEVHQSITWRIKNELAYKHLWANEKLTA